jgi:glycosyltransferase involved in cell wall biosynthesis
MVELNPDVELSVIVPVGGRQADPATLYAEYKTGLDAMRQRYEMIFVLDGPREKFAAGLRALLDAGERFTVISLSRPFGEATALMAGFEHASGQVIVTLPAYHQIEAADVAKLVAGLDSADVVIGHRHPRAGGPFERMRRALYGEQHRFLAVLADRQGFRVREADVRQSAKDRFEGVYQPREYTRGFLDIFTVFFLVRFTKRPLRFFGMVGVTTFAVGAIAVTWMVIERLFFSQGLADRPALLLASLLVVLGLQLFALGLLGELMIFTHARGLKDYQIERVIQFRDERANSANRAVAS